MKHKNSIKTKNSMKHNKYCQGTSEFLSLFGQSGLPILDKDKPGGLAMSL